MKRATRFEDARNPLSGAILPDEHGEEAALDDLWRDRAAGPPSAPPDLPAPTQTPAAGRKEV